MIIPCKVCGKDIDIKKYKGIQKSILVCSRECFVLFLEQNRGNVPIGELLENFYKNKTPAVFSNAVFLADSRSQAERDLMKLLKDLDIKYKYETYSVMNTAKKIYLPDFYLPEYNLFIEVKDGLWEQGAYAKFSRFSKIINLYLMEGKIIRRLLNEK